MIKITDYFTKRIVTYLLVVVVLLTVLFNGLFYITNNALVNESDYALNEAFVETVAERLSTGESFEVVLPYIKQYSIRNQVRIRVINHENDEIIFETENFDLKHASVFGMSLLNTDYSFLVDREETRYKQYQDSLVVRVNLIVLLILVLSVSFIYLVSKRLSNELVKDVYQVSRDTKKLLSGELIQTDEIKTFELKELSEEIHDLYHDMKKNQLARKVITDQVSHEIKTPLTIIEHELSKLDNTEHIKKEVVRLNELANTLNDDNQIITFKRVDLSQLLNEYLLPYKSLLKTKKIDLVLDIESDINHEIYAPFIKQIISNLMMNVFHYAYPNTEAVVSLKINDGIKLSVYNEGVGIKKENFNKIFSNYYRLSEGISKNPNGSGLGLGIVKEYVEFMNGHISVDSNYQKDFKILIQF
jgi:signal transduction histidine kinase